MKTTIFLCLLVTSSVICSDQINDKKSYGVNGLLDGNPYNGFKDRKGLRFGSKQIWYNKKGTL